MDGTLLAAIIGAVAVVVGPLLLEWYRRRRDRRVDPIPAPPTPAPIPPAPPQRTSADRYPNLDAEGYPDYLNVGSLPATPRTDLRHESPNAMAEALADLSPIQRPEAAAQLFRGRWTRRRGTVFNTYENDACYSVALTHDLGGYVTLTLPLDRRAEVEPLRAGDRLTFEGQVLRYGDSIGSAAHVELVRVWFVADG